MVKKMAIQLLACKIRGIALKNRDVLSGRRHSVGAMATNTAFGTITVLETSESTMTDAKRAILDQDAARQYFDFVADMQEMPRGRFGPAVSRYAR